MWHLSMGNKTAYISCVVGVLVFMSMVQSQDYGGTPGVDYPNYFTVPETSFKCSEQQYNPGFYADLETKCQAFHFCYQDRQETFLCPTGTIFNQAMLTCDVWHKSNCSLAPIFYSVNVGPVMERAGKNLPMLLRLRNRSQNNPSEHKSTSAVEKSSLHGKSKATPAENGIAEDEASKLKDVVDKSDDGSSDKDEQIFHGVDEHFEKVDADTYEADYLNESADEEIDDTNLVYDPNPGAGYYRNYDQYESDSEPVSDEFGRFYDYRNSGNEYGSERTSQSQMNYVADEPVDSGLNEYSDFAARNFRADQPLRRVRRKPVYVVLDSEPQSQAEMETGTSTNESNNASAQSESAEVDMATPSPEPFPRPTRYPPHLLELSTETPMTSEEFGAAIFTELVLPQLPDDYGTVLASTYPQEANMTTSFQSDGVSMDTQSDDETIYIENDLEPENYEPYEPQSDDETIYVENDLESENEPQGDDETIYIKNDIEPENYEPYDSQYEDVVISESGEESYPESPDTSESASSGVDTLVVIPDEYDDSGSVFNEHLEMSNYPDENAYRTETLADDPELYENYRYSSSRNYPDYYRQTPMINEQVMPQKWFDHHGANFHPEMVTRMYPNDQRYSYQSNYEFQDQLPVSHESRYVEDTELYPLPEAEFGITDSPLELPVTEEDLDNFSTEDFGDVASNSEVFIEDEQAPNKPEDVYYVLDLDEEQSSEGNETKVEEDVNLGFEESFPESSVHVDEQSYETKQVNSTNEESASPSNVVLDTESDKLESAKNDNSGFESSLTITENEQIESLDNMKSTSVGKNPKDTLTKSNLEQAGQPKPPAYGSMSSLKTQSPVMSGFDFSTDSRFLSNMGYSDSMDFGPYGFGPMMEQQFSMLESMPQSKSSPFSQRMGQTEQSKMSPLSAIQEKMRSMKQGKFGAFKKYMSSSSTR